MAFSGTEARPVGATQAVAAPAESGRPDPWGVKRAENLLQSLQSVLSARVVVSPVGDITEVHILAQSGVAPKQVVRNVESALLAHLGIKVDHRKISVAQTAEVQPIEALEQSAIKTEAMRRGVVYMGMESMAAAPHRVRFKVTLEVNGVEVIGEEDAVDTTKARMQAVARAAVVALDKALPSGTFQLEGVKTFEAFDTELVIAGVHVVDGRLRRLLTGTAEIEDAVEQSAVLAVLDATNRWFQSRQT